MTRTSEAETSPRFTADGHHVTYTRASNLYLMSLDSGEVDQPVQVLRRSFRVRAGDHAQYDFNLEEGWEFEITVSADDYVGVSSCGQRDYKRWIDGGELMQYEGEDDARHCELDFTAPKNGTYLLLVINEGAEDVDVTLDASLWEEAAEE